MMITLRTSLTAVPLSDLVGEVSPRLWPVVLRSQSGKPILGRGDSRLGYRREDAGDRPYPVTNEPVRPEGRTGSRTPVAGQRATCRCAITSGSDAEHWAPTTHTSAWAASAPGSAIT